MMHFQVTSARYGAVEPSSGSNVILRQARPGLAGLGPHRGAREVRAGGVEHTPRVGETTAT